MMVNVCECVLSIRGDTLARAGYRYLTGLFSFVRCLEDLPVRAPEVDTRAHRARWCRPPETARRRTADGGLRERRKTNTL